MFGKLRQLFTHGDEQKAIGAIYSQNLNNNAHIIALARLLFIKPERLAKEAKNYRANAEYLNKMTEFILSEHEVPQAKAS